MRQLALAFTHRPRLDQAAFLPAASNAAALAFLAADPAAWPHRLWLWGPAGCGKTHLLHLWTGRRSPDAALLEAAAIPRLAIDGALPAASLAIDGADAIGDEHALLHILNIAAERHVPLVLASRISPARIEATLPDLASRLRATLAVEIGPPEDELLDALLGRLLADRQLAVHPAVGRYLRTHLPREPDILRRAVERLDAASLEGRRPITIGLAQALIAELDRSDTEPSSKPVSAITGDLV